MTLTAPRAHRPRVRRPAPKLDWRRWVRAGLVGAAALWLAFTVTHLLVSGRWWLWLAVDAIPPVAFVGVPVLLALGAAPCRRSRRPVALLAIGALLLGGSLSGINVQRFSGGDGPAPAGAVRILSWNTAYWDEGGQTEALYRFLRDADADVYLLQEYWYTRGPGPDASAVARLRAEFPGFDVAIVGELVTLSRLPILREIPLVAPDLPASMADATAHFRHKTLRTDLDLGSGRVLSTYNTHLPVPLSPEHGPWDGDFYRILREQYAQREPQWRALATDVDGNDHPVLVAGDLNTSPAMGELRELPDGLRDARHAMASWYPASWLDTAGWPRWWRLDWALVSPQVKVHSYRFTDAEGLSDHRAQELVLSLG